MRKILSLLAMLILVLTSTGAVAVSIKEINSNIKWGQSESKAVLLFDELDQYQPDMDFFGPVGVCFLAPGLNYIIAQSFIPTKNTLTRVELMVGKNSTTTYDYIVAIRESLNGPDLTSINVPAENIVIENFSWVEFNFDDIGVIPGNTYYIVSYTANVTDNWYAWGMKSGNVYLDGTVYYTVDDGTTWTEEPDGDMTFKTYGIDNLPPETPTIDGQTNGNVGVTYDYTFVSTDPNGDQVYYYIDFGDETGEICIGPFDSGAPQIVSHKYTEKGTYIIKAKAKDIYNAESDWGTLTVTMPRNKAISTPFLKFLQNHPNIFLLIQYLLGL